MEYWKDENEAINIFLKLFEECKKESDVFEGLKKINQLIWYDCTENGPNCSVWVDTRGGKLLAGPGKPAENPDLTLSMSADHAHKAWSNKASPIVAITTKKIRIKGNATSLLKLSPHLKKVAEIYNRVLEENSLSNLILK
ncbi:MAG: SCP2 sterol-binding domain-containing protein [Deltaproteobacteria bacterium]|nr:SCP2 sterol-binding domain-containing protein [Deltaproteobacteria bacterium]